MSEKNAWNLELVTERLILRPHQPNDYEAWYAGFASRLPSQHKYDEGQVDLDEVGMDWVRHNFENFPAVALPIYLSSNCFTTSGS